MCWNEIKHIFSSISIIRTWKMIVSFITTHSTSVSGLKSHFSKIREVQFKLSSSRIELRLTSSLSRCFPDAPSSVSVSGPRQVTLGEVVSLTCETSESNPPAVLTWRVDGKHWSEFVTNSHAKRCLSGNNIIFRVHGSFSKYNTVHDIILTRRQGQTWLDNYDEM